MHNSNKNLVNRILFDKIQKLERQNNVVNKTQKAKPVETFTLLFSIVAICVSVVNMYFQFFYEKNNLTANFVDSHIINDTTITAKIIFHNKGNQNETVLGNTIFFYQDSTKMENDRIIFSSESTEQVYISQFDPMVLNPGQQIFKELKQPFNFSELGQQEFNFTPNDTIRIGLQIDYINDRGLHSNNNICLGWLTLDKNKNVEYWQVKYKSVILESSMYTSSSYVIPKERMK